MALSLPQAPRELSEITSLEDSLTLPRFTADDAWILGTTLRERLLPAAQAVVINITLANSNQLLFHTVTRSGTAPDNDLWVARKRETVLRWGVSSWYMHVKMQGNEEHFTKKYMLGGDAGTYAIHGGGVPIRVQGVEGVIAVVVVSGLKQEEDHMVVVDGLKSLKSRDIQSLLRTLSERTHPASHLTMAWQSVCVHGNGECGYSTQAPLLHITLLQPLLTSPRSEHEQAKAQGVLVRIRLAAKKAIPRIIFEYLSGYLAYWAKTSKVSLAAITIVHSNKNMNGAKRNASPQEIPVTKLLANFVAAANPGMLSDALRAKVKEVVIDFIGVTAGAAKDAESTESIVKGIRALGGDQGSSTVFLHSKHFLPQYAALLNAAFGHSFDYDDTYAAGTLHAGVTTISAALAQAEVLGADSSSQEFMMAVCVGYEVTCRLGRELGYEAYSQGMHNTGTAGIFGAVAAISVLKRLPAHTVEMAFGLAGSKAAGSMQYLENGSWNKRLHPGFAAHDAFVCVALAEAGVIGATKIIEGKHGFLHAYSPRQNKSMTSVVENLAYEWTWLASSLKPYPACRMTHGFIEMAGRMGDMKREGVDHITLTLNPQNYILVGDPIPNKLHPKNSIDAQFSAYYQVANAWLYGSNTGWRAYDRLNDAQLHELCDRISVKQDASCRNFECRIKVRWADGKELEEVMLEPLGEVSHPFTRDKVDDKFHSLADPVYGEKEAKTIIDMVDGIEKHSVVELLRLIQ